MEIIDLKNRNFYKMKIISQGFYLGYACAARRLLDADQQGKDFNTLYSSNLEDFSFIDLSCSSRAAKDALERREFELQMNFTEGLNRYTPISQPLDNIGSAFKESIEYQIYILFFSHAIYDINDRLQKQEKLNSSSI
jgi:hypothetical protein